MKTCMAVMQNWRAQVHILSNIFNLVNSKDFLFFIFMMKNIIVLKFVLLVVHKMQAI